MSAYIIVHGTPKDPEKFGQYAAGAGPIIQKHGGAIVAKGPASVLAGSSPHAIAALLEFPNAAAAKAFYADEAYQALIPLRDEAADVTFVLVGD